MNASINYSGFTDLYMDSGNDFKPYGCNDISETLENVYNIIESFKANFDDRNYAYDESVSRINLYG